MGDSLDKHKNNTESRGGEGCTKVKTIYATRRKLKTLDPS